MNENLSIQLAMHPDCTLVVRDNSPYETWETDLGKHVAVEFVIYGTDSRPNPRNIFATKINGVSTIPTLQEPRTIALTKDGNWSYYKMIIPELDHLWNEQEEKYDVENETFCYMGEYYIGPKNLYSETRYYTKEEALSKSTKTSDYLQLYKENGSQTFIFNQSVFSACKVQQCLIKLQKLLIKDFSRTCSMSDCNRNIELKHKCDLMLSIVTVLDYLVSLHRFEEAQRIIDSLAGCGNICDDISSSFTTNSCGCGNSI